MWWFSGATRKTRIIDVVYNASNNELVRTKTLVKNAIVVVDATPFRQWYESHYLLPLGRKKGAKLVSLCWRYSMLIIVNNSKMYLSFWVFNVVPMNNNPFILLKANLIVILNLCLVILDINMTPYDDTVACQMMIYDLTTWKYLTEIVRKITQLINLKWS